jgi:hypothetical protein
MESLESIDQELIVCEELDRPINAPFFDANSNFD